MSCDAGECGCGCGALLQVHVEPDSGMKALSKEPLILEAVLAEPGERSEGSGS
jgi:hypothetical protein